MHLSKVRGCSIKGNLRENQLRWWGLVQHMLINALIRENDRIIINRIMRTKGTPKRTWVKATKKDMLMPYVTKEIDVI